MNRLVQKINIYKECMYISFVFIWILVFLRKKCKQKVTLFLYTLCFLLYIKLYKSYYKLIAHHTKTGLNYPFLIMNIYPMRKIRIN